MNNFSYLDIRFILQDRGRNIGRTVGAARHFCTDYRQLLPAGGRFPNCKKNLPHEDNRTTTEFHSPFFYIHRCVEADVEKNWAAILEFLH
jgi:hypothetical protein